MKIFISWSKQPSRLIAEELKHFLSMTLGAVHVWMSEVDIQKGKRWGDQIAAELDSTKVGILVCTKGNVREPWLHFEAGALAKTKDSLVHPICFGIEKSELQGALKLFQATVFERDDILELLRQLNDASDAPLRSKDLDARFERAWPQLQAKVFPAIVTEPGTPAASAAGASIERSAGIESAPNSRKRLSQVLASALSSVASAALDSGTTSSFNPTEAVRLLQTVAYKGGAIDWDTAESLSGLSSDSVRRYAEALEEIGYLRAGVATLRLTPKGSVALASSLKES